MATRRVVGWLLHLEDRDRLLAPFPPACPEVVAHHVTLKAGVPQGVPLPAEREGFVAGVAEDGPGVQAIVVDTGGTTRRPDGSTCHVTRSLRPGRRQAVERNDATRGRGRTAAAERHRIRLEPAVIS